MLTHNTCIRAEIVDVHELSVRCNGDIHDAEYAMSAPTVLHIGDQVLCMQDGEGAFYVLAPIGKTKHWQFAADKIEMDAQILALNADRLELTARRLFEKTIDAYRWTSNLLQWCCGRQRTLIDGQQQVRAGRIDVHAKGNVRIDGEQINLG